MDPVTHGLVGAAAGSWCGPKEKLRALMSAGALSAMAPDLDVLINRSSDPLYQLEFHRQFSHSLLFAPFGALIVSITLWWLFRRWLNKREMYQATLAGFLTAGLLDACTSYGTQLLWPISTERLAWNLTPVVEPIFTLILLILTLAIFRIRSRTAQTLAAVLIVLFLGHGALQKQRAHQAAIDLHQSRGHRPEKLVVKPTLGNQILWRVTYIYAGRVYTDGIRTGFFGTPAVYEGEDLPLLSLESDFRDLKGTRTHKDLQRFSRLSQGFLVLHPAVPNVIGDGRYAMLPNSMTPLWGLEYDPANPDQAPRFRTFRDSSADIRAAFWEMLNP